MMNFNDLPLLSLKNQSKPQDPGKMQFILGFVPFALCHFSIPYSLEEKRGEQEAVSCSRVGCIVC